MEQIIAKLREIEKLTAQGMSVPMAARRVGVADQTFYRWRIRYGALKEEEAQTARRPPTEPHRLGRDELANVRAIGLTARSTHGSVTTTTLV